MATMNTYFETNTHRHWLIDEKKTSWTLNAVSEASIKYTNAQYTLHTEKLRRMFHHPGIASGNLTLDHEEAQVRTTLYHTLSRGGRWWHWCGSHQVFRTRIEPTIRPGCRRWDRRRRTRGGHERNDCKWWCHLWYIHHEPSTCFPHWMIDRNERSDDDGKKCEQKCYCDGIRRISSYDLWFTLTTVCWCFHDATVRVVEWSLFIKQILYVLELW